MVQVVGSSAVALRERYSRRLDRTEACLAPDLAWGAHRTASDGMAPASAIAPTWAMARRHAARDGRACSHPRAGEAGTSILEFALIMPLMLLIVLGIMEGARLLNAWAVMTAEVTEGARYGAVEFSDPAREPSIVSDVTAHIRGRVSGSLDLSQLAITVTPFSVFPDKWLTVSLVYRHPVYTPLIADLIPNPIALRASAVMRGE